VKHLEQRQNYTKLLAPLNFSVQVDSNSNFKS